MTDLRPADLAIGQTVMLLDWPDGAMFADVVAVAPLAVKPHLGWTSYWPPYIPAAGERVKIMAGGKLVIRTVPAIEERRAA
jgi:hypothetical protein